MASHSSPLSKSKRPRQKGKVGDKANIPREPSAPAEAKPGGMIGEAMPGAPTADITEAEPRSQRPGGMIGEGE